MFVVCCVLVVVCYALFDIISGCVLYGGICYVFVVVRCLLMIAGRWLFRVA